VPSKPRKAKSVRAAPQFDDCPLADDEEEGACPIPDEHGEVVLRRSKTTREGTGRGKAKGTGKKPAG
jgi:hypothetical protein